MPDPGLPPPTQPAQIVLDRWLHDFWKWARSFVKSVRAADNSIVVTRDSDNNVTLRVPGGGAPADATYATVTDESAVLINSRQLAAGANVSLTDNGPGSTLVIAASGGSVSPLTTKGDLWGFSTVDARVPVGADGQVLTADSAQTLGVKWAAAGGGGGALVQIAQVVTSGSQATVVFSAIPGTYKNLRVEYICQDTAAGSGLIGLWLQVNSDNTAGNYTSEQFIDGFGSTALVSTDASSANGAFAGLYAGTSGLATAFGTGTIWINGYAQTTFQKMARFHSAAYYSGPTQRIRNGAFVWKNTAAITTLKFTSSATAFTNGSIFTLYGLT